MLYLANSLTLRIEHCSPPNTCYLRWLSNLGTWEGWVFTSGELKAQPDDPTQISTADGRGVVAVRRASTETLTIQAENLTPGQYAGLLTILFSPQVYMQHPNGDRQPVLLAANSNATRLVNETKSELEITILLPAQNSLTH